MAIVLAQERDTASRELLAYFERAGAVVTRSRDLVLHLRERAVEIVLLLTSSAAHRVPAPSKISVTSSPSWANSSTVRQGVGRATHICVCLGVRQEEDRCLGQEDQRTAEPSPRRQDEQALVAISFDLAHVPAA